MVQFALADGSVRKLALAIDRNQFYALGGKHDGDRVSWDAFQ